jgi:hypothetical protein
VFGFFLVFDAFIHAITETPAGKRAEKGEAILAQIGTRDLRVTKRRPYRRLKGRVVFDDPPPEDIDMRGLDVVSDPYASIFVSVPPPTGQPS